MLVEVHQVDAKNIALARDTVDSRSTKVKDVQILKDAQKRAGSFDTEEK
jgi:hypothetical protein